MESFNKNMVIEESFGKVPPQKYIKLTNIELNVLF